MPVFRQAIARDSEIPSNTGDLTEGSNLYFTNARADARISTWAQGQQPIWNDT